VGLSAGKLVRFYRNLQKVIIFRKTIKEGKFINGLTHQTVKEPDDRTRIGGRRGNKIRHVYAPCNAWYNTAYDPSRGLSC